jgi:hypothetical protein
MDMSFEKMSMEMSRAATRLSGESPAISWSASDSSSTSRPESKVMEEGSERGAMMAFV